MASLLRKGRSRLNKLLSHQFPTPPSPLLLRHFSSNSKPLPEYQMPTVTWGAIHGRKERLVSRVLISDYLSSLGIIPDELQPLELPSSVDVMRERVQFLHNLGLTVDDINAYPLLLACSLRKNVIPVLSYLQKLGIAKSDLGLFVRRYPQVLHASVVVELVPVVKFLRGLDIERDDIPFVLQKYPELLGFKLEGTMSTSVAYLVSIGVSKRDVGPMATQFPYSLGMRVGTVIKPIVDYLVELGFPKKIVARMLEKRPYVLGYSLEESVKPNVECLISFGVRKELLPMVIAQFPQLLGIPLNARLSESQIFFNSKLGYSPEGFARMVERMPQVVCLQQRLVLKVVEFFRGRGIRDEDVRKMVIECPQLFTVGLESMKNSFYFFKSEIRRPMMELVEFPVYFTYSLESRIKPRFGRLMEKGIGCWSLNWMLNCSDQMFYHRVQRGFAENEAIGPQFFMGGLLQMPGQCEDAVSTEDEEKDEEEILYRRVVSL